jgi:hypothetical protein
MKASLKVSTENVKRLKEAMTLVRGMHLGASTGVYRNGKPDMVSVSADGLAALAEEVLLSRERASREGSQGSQVFYRIKRRSDGAYWDHRGGWSTCAAPVYAHATEERPVKLRKAIAKEEIDFSGGQMHPAGPGQVPYIVKVTVRVKPRKSRA